MTLRNLDSTRPSITLNFKRSKKLDPRVTFTRASFADSAGNPFSAPSAGSGVAGGQFNMFNVNVPRLTDHGLLIEKSETNRITSSTNFSASGWNDVTTTVTGTQPGAPDGSSTASLLTEASINNSTNALFYTTSGAITAPWSFSIFAKANTGVKRYFQLRARDLGSDTCAAVFDLSSGQITDTTGTEFVDAGIQAVGNGWYRVYIVCSENCENFEVTITDTPEAESSGYVGTTGSFFIWGAQLEESSFSSPTSYIPTAGLEVTRAADLCEIVGNNLSSWFTNSEGSFVSNFSTAETDQRVLIFRGDTTGVSGSTGAVLLINNTGTPLQASGAGVGKQEQLAANTGDNFTGQDLKVAFGYDSTRLSCRVNVDVASNTAVDFTAKPEYPERFDLGQDGADASMLNGTISSISFYPTRLSNEALQALTV